MRGTAHADMAPQVIDLTEFEPSVTRSRSRAEPIEVIDLTDDDQDDDDTRPLTIDSPNGASGSFDEFLKLLKDQHVTDGIGNRQLERLRELWDDGTLNDLSESETLSDEFLREIFFHSITVVKARDVLRSLRQLRRKSTNRTQGQVSAKGMRFTLRGLRSSASRSNAPSPNQSPSVRAERGQPAPAKMSTRATEPKHHLHTSDAQEVAEETSGSGYQTEMADTPGEESQEEPPLQDSDNGSLALQSGNSSPASRTVSERLRDLRVEFHEIVSSLGEDRDGIGIAELDTEADSPRTPAPLRADDDLLGSPDTASSQRRSRDSHGRFTGSSDGSRKTTSPSHTKRLSKRGNETKLLKENLMHGNFKPAVLSNSGMAGPGLRSATRARSSSSRQASEQAIRSADMSNPVHHQNSDATPSRYDSDLEHAQQGSEPPLLEDDIDMYSRESGMEEPTEVVLRTLEAVEQVLLEHAKELAQDHEYYIKHYLAAARGAVGSLGSGTSSHADINGKGDEHVRKSSAHVDTISPFADMEAIDTIKDAGTDINEDEAVLAQVVNPSQKGPKGAHRSTLSVQVTPFTTDDFQVPFYTHYVSAGANFRAENSDKLLYAPYFHDDQEQTPDLKGLENHLNHEYKNLVDKRPTYVQLLHRSSKWRPYVTAFLDDIGCNDGDVLRYLLQPGLDATTDLGLDLKTLLVWKNRGSFGKGDFDTGHPKWREVLRNLPPSTDKALAFAGLAYHAFLKVANFDIWHVVRRSATVEAARSAVQPASKVDALTEIQNALCRVCHRLNCPYHGINLEENDSSPDEEGEETDASGSLKSKESSRIRAGSPSFEGYYSSDEDGINDEKLVLAPKHGRIRSPRSPRVPAFRRPFDVGRWIDKGVTNMMHRRKPFWPCDHEGSCESKKCRCWRQGINCEKACGCSRSCKRRFPGCTCAQKGKPCSSESKCACRALNRECDADICGSCGARDILDPVNRYDEDLRIGRCHNAFIQLDRPKNTKVGVSQVVGCGLYACEDISQGSYISEYKGEICGHQEGERRGVTNGYRPNNYLFTVSGDTYDVDSMHYGNKTRFINNSQNPRNINVEAKLKLCNMVVRIGMFATRDIRAGEELFFNYGYEKQISDTFWEPGESPKEKTLRRIGAASSKRKSKAKAQLSTSISPASTESSPHEGRIQKTKYRRRLGTKLDEIPQDDENDIDYRPNSQGAGLRWSKHPNVIVESESDDEDVEADAEEAETPNGRHRRPRSAQNTPRGKFNTKESWSFVEDSNSEDSSDDEDEEYEGSDETANHVVSDNGASRLEAAVIRGRKRKRVSAH